MSGKISFARIGIAVDTALSLESMLTPALQRDAPECVELDCSFRGEMCQCAPRVTAPVIAGFTVRDRGAEQRVRWRRIQEFREDRAAVTEILGPMGITPLAVLPMSVFGKLCELAGLYRLTPDDKGKVKVVTANPPLSNSATMFLFMVCLAGVACLLPYVVHVRDVVGETSSMLDMALTVVACLLVAAVVTVLLKMVMLPYVRVAATPLQSHRATLKAFFPGGTDQKGRTSVQLVLPQPPPEVEAILLKARGLPLSVAAVGEAISFTETPTMIRWRALRKQRQAWRKKLANRLLALADPIIYYECGGAVAILAHFGDSPIEQAMVDRVVHSEFLIV